MDCTRDRALPEAGKASDGTFVALAGPGTVKDCGESEVSLRMHEASCR